MAESSAVPVLHGLAFDAFEWLPSGAESGLVRVRGRWTDEAAREGDLPVLALQAAGADHRFDSLPDARISRDPSTWRGTYLVPAELVASDPEALWLEWPSGTRSGLPALSRGVEPPPVPAAPERPEEPAEPGGQVIDRAVLAERRARRAEAAEQAQAKVAAEALKALEVLELRSAELERRLAETGAPGTRDAEAASRREALAAALASAAALRTRSREWQLRLRTNEVARAGDSVRLAVLEAERATGTEAIRTALRERGAELESVRRRLADQVNELAAAGEAAAAARSDLEAADRRRQDLESSLAALRSDLTAAREQADELRRSVDTERTAHEHTRAELEAATEALRGDAQALQARVEALEAALATSEGRTQTAEAALAAAEARLRVETVARSTLEDELDRERARVEAGFEAELERERPAMREGFDAELERERAALRAAFDAERTATRAELERERASIRAAFEVDRTAARAAFEADHETVRAALADAERRAAATEAGERSKIAELRAALEAERAARAEAESRIGELEHRAAAGRAELERLALEQARAAAAHEPGGNPTRLVADLDAAAEALRRRTPEPADDSPPMTAGETEPGPAEGDPASEEAMRAPPEDEPPAPDAEPAVEWADRDDTKREPCAPGVQPVRPPAGVEKPVPWAPPGFESSDTDEPDEPPAPDAEPGVEWTPPAEPPPSNAAAPAPAEAVTEPVAGPPEPAGPVIVPASRPPARALVVGTNRRDYPLLRGAIVKLAHDDPNAAGRLLAALLPAQGVAIEGALAYDVTIREAGTFGVAIAGGRASVERLDTPQSRSVAEFHLIGDALAIAELLAGVNHRIGRFFGPVRARGRKRRLRDLRALTAGTISLEDAAKAGARLDPELVYRTLAYAVHPSWTRGCDFTIAQEIVGEPPETWYLTARDGAGLTVSSTAPAEPDATVTMDRDVFDRLLRGQAVSSGRRPSVHGDREAVAQMQIWTERARGDVA